MHTEKQFDNFESMHSLLHSIVSQVNTQNLIFSVVCRGYGFILHIMLKSSNRLLSAMFERQNASVNVTI